MQLIGNSKFVVVAESWSEWIAFLASPWANDTADLLDIDCRREDWSRIQSR